ncbi:hypothetical protein ACHAWF_002028 [Thalassiosira exigua]
MDEKSTPTGGSGKPSKPVVRGKGKGKALNAIAAASGRDPAAIVKSVTEAEAAAKAAAARAQAEEDAKKAAEERSQAKAKEEVTVAQVFDSLSPQDQYRFECFRRCGFASKPVEKFVAKMLIEEAEKRYSVRRGAMASLGGNLGGHVNHSREKSPPENTVATSVTDTSDASSATLGSSKKRKKRSNKHLLKEESKRRMIAMDRPLPYCNGHNVLSGNKSMGGSVGSGKIPPLDSLVVPHSSSEIVAVVSTLAKCYAQRLVSAAKRLANAEEEEQELSGTLYASTARTEKPLLPHHFLEAHRHRARAGIDPGFWMAKIIETSKKGLTLSRGGVGAAQAAALGTVDRGRTCYMAALAAQEAFDREIEIESEDQMEVEESE